MIRSVICYGHNHWCWCVCLCHRPPAALFKTCRFWVFWTFSFFLQNPIFWQQLSNFEVLQKNIQEFSHASINISYLKLLINACDPFRLWMHTCLWLIDVYRVPSHCVSWIRTFKQNWWHLSLWGCKSFEGVKVFGLRICLDWRKLERWPDLRTWLGACVYSDWW